VDETRFQASRSLSLYSAPPVRFSVMKVAYVFTTSGHTVDYKLGKMILPQLEAGTHGAQVVGMFFFDDNAYALRKGDPLGERLAKVAKQHNIWLGVCDMCALDRGLAEGEPVWCNSDRMTARSKAAPERIRLKNAIDGLHVGCFPDLYAALATNPPDVVVSL
jgi:sulfur relay (sulfurtransferase) complex TusBCD TusD component (DsrE family)